MDKNKKAIPFCGMAFDFMPATTGSPSRTVVLACFHCRMYVSENRFFSSTLRGTQMWPAWHFSGERKVSL